MPTVRISLDPAGVHCSVAEAALHLRTGYYTFKVVNHSVFYIFAIVASIAVAIVAAIAAAIAAAIVAAIVVVVAVGVIIALLLVFLLSSCCLLDLRLLSSSTPPT
jgi:uncharacterized protein YacL